MAEGTQIGAPAGFDLGSGRPRRKPSLTPMIDVVFLLLVFFMLAARFGTDQTVRLNAGGGTGEYAGPPRLIEVLEAGFLVNGIAVEADDLLSVITPLTENPEDVLVLRSRDGANTQGIVDALTLLQDGGFTNLALVE